MPDPKTHVVACHGWGFSRTFWNPIRDLLDDTFIFDVAERGYFSKKKTPKFCTNSDLSKVLITHSYGLHWCSDTLLKQADHLIIMGGFLQFHPQNKDEGSRSKLIVRQMLSHFVEKPDEVLKQFYKNSFHPTKTNLNAPKDMDHDLLLADLSDLHRDLQPRQRIFDMNNITIIHGSDDLIVQKQNARQMFNELKYRSQYFEILRAGHAFPVTHADKCLEIIKTVIEPE